MLIALRYNDRSRWLLFTEAKLFGLNGIIMHRGPCAALNVRKALDSSATRLPRRRRRPGCRRGAYQAACRRTARCAQDWIGADGPPFTTALLSQDSRATKDDCRVPIWILNQTHNMWLFYYCVLLNCALRCAKNDNSYTYVCTLA